MPYLLSNLNLNSLSITRKRYGFDQKRFILLLQGNNSENDQMCQCILKPSHFKINCYRCSTISTETVVHALRCLG